MNKIVIISGLFLVHLIGGCSSGSSVELLGRGDAEEEKEEKKKRRQKDADSKAERVIGHDKKQGSDLKSNKKSSAREKVEEVDPAKPFAGCGYESFENINFALTQEIHSSDTLAEGTERGVDYAILFKNKLAMSVNPSQIASSVFTNLISVEPDNAQGRAEERVNRIAGTKTMDLENPGDFQELLGGTKDIPACGLTVANKLLEQGEFVTTFKIEPPTPLQFNMGLSKERFLQEFSGPVTFEYSSIVTKTNNPDSAIGDTYKASITFSPEDPSIVMEGVQINADYAIRVKSEILETVNNRPEGDEDEEEEDAGPRNSQSDTTYYMYDGSIIGIYSRTGKTEVSEIYYFPQD